MAMEWNWKRGNTLGSGAFGSVSLAEVDEETSKRFKLPPLLAVKSAEVGRSCSLQREEEFLHQLEGCPNVLRCFGSDINVRKDGVEMYNLFLEYAEGGSLAGRIKGLRESAILMDEDEVRRHARSLLAGLSFIHERGFVHCDVKPHNVLLILMEEYDGALEAKLADFGLAKRGGKVDDDEELGEVKLSCGIRGTVMYMAPESARHEYEPPCDVWALGCVVLEMITGKPPWEYNENADPCSILFKIAFGDKVPEIPDWVSEDAKDFLGKCIVRDPKDRWTADMLFGHPFVSSSQVENEAERVGDKRMRARSEQDQEISDICNGLLPSGNCWKVQKNDQTLGPRNVIPLMGF